MDLELDLLAIVKNVAQLANISTQKLVFAVHVAMDSSNPMKVHSNVKFAAWVKPQDQLKPNQEPNVVTSAHQECNWEPMENANHAHVELTALKEFNQLVKLAH